MLPEELRHDVGEIRTNESDAHAVQSPFSPGHNG